MRLLWQRYAGAAGRRVAGVILAIASCALVACGKTTTSSSGADSGPLPPVPVAFASPSVVTAEPVPDDPTCTAIAADIIALKRKLAVLADFDGHVTTHGPSCRISYTRHCHRSTVRGGWVASVPEPDPDGLWFYIGVWDDHDPDERGSQINTQPAIGNHRIGERRVTFLVLQGRDGGNVTAELNAILVRHGMR